jgi:hypothetical protein
MAGPDRRDIGVNSRAAEFRDFHTLLDFPIQAHRRPVQFQAGLLDLLAESLWLQQNSPVQFPMPWVAVVFGKSEPDKA